MKKKNIINECNDKEKKQQIYSEIKREISSLALSLTLSLFKI